MSDIFSRLEPAGRFAHSMLVARYNIATSVKINAKEFKDTVNSSYLAGMIAVAEVIAMTHKENPYKNIDEIIGDLQLIIHDSHGKLNKLHWRHMKPTTFDKIVSDTTAQELLQ